MVGCLQEVLSVFAKWLRRLLPHEGALEKNTHCGWWVGVYGVIEVLRC